MEITAMVFRKVATPAAKECEATRPMVDAAGAAAAQLAHRLAALAPLAEAVLAELDHLAVVGADEAGRAEQVGLAQPPARHLGRVVGKAEMRPDEIELALAARHD